MPASLPPRSLAPLAALLAACALAPAASAQQRDTAEVRPPQEIPLLYPHSVQAVVGEDRSGLRFRVDELRPSGGAPARVPVAPVRPLTAAEAQRVLAQLRPLRAAGAEADRKSTRLNSSHQRISRMPSSA